MLGIPAGTLPQIAAGADFSDRVADLARRIGSGTQTASRGRCHGGATLEMPVRCAATRSRRARSSASDRLVLDLGLGERPGRDVCAPASRAAARGGGSRAERSASSGAATRTPPHRSRAARSDDQPVRRERRSSPIDFRRWLGRRRLTARRARGRPARSATSSRTSRRPGPAAPPPTGTRSPRSSARARRRGGADGLLPVAVGGGQLLVRPVGDRRAVPDARRRLR